mgnify:FL=1
MTIVELDTSQYVKQGRIFKKFESNLLDSYMDGRQTQYNINLADLDDQISDGIVYADKDGKMIYKFSAKKIVQTAITKDLTITGLADEFKMDYYSFWVPDLYLISYRSFNPDSGLYLAYRKKDEKYICLTNVWPDRRDQENSYFPNGKKLEVKSICTGSMMSDIDSAEYSAWKNDAVTRASQYVNKFISARGNADLNFVSSTLREKVPSHNIKLFAEFLGAITKEQENVNTYEEFIEWTKNTKWFK